MINDKDVKKLKKTFVTKDDLKKELSRYATKKDIERIVDSIAIEIAQDIGGMIQEQKEVNKRIDAAHKRLDVALERIDSSNVRMDAILEELRSNRIVLGNHEERIQNVETKVFPSPSTG